MQIYEGPCEVSDIDLDSLEISSVDQNNTQKSNFLDLLNTNFSNVMDSRFSEASQNNFSFIEKRMTEIRSVLTENNDIVIDFISNNFITNIISLASIEEENKIKFETLWILCNIACGPKTHIEELIKSGAIEVFIRCLDCNTPNIVEHAIWGLGNIIAEDQEKFLAVLKHDFIDKILVVIQKFPYDYILGVISWTMRNICHYHSLINNANTNKILEICGLLLEVDSIKIKEDILWSVVYLTRKENSKLESLLESKFFELAFKYLFHESQVLIPAIRLFGNICSGTHSQTQKVLDIGLLDKLMSIMNVNDPNVLKEAYWTLSNVSAGNLDQLRLLESHPIFYPSIKGIINPNHIVRNEASYFIYNYLKLSTQDMKKKIFTSGLMSLLQQALEDKQSEIVLNLISMYEYYIEIKGIKSFLKHGYDKDIDQLTKHNNPEVYIRCVDLLEKYLGLQDD